MKRLLESARDGPLEELKLAELSFPASELAAVKEGRGRNALHMAAIGGKVDICSYLVKERHFDINSFDEQGAHCCEQGRTCSSSTDAHQVRDAQVARR